MSSNGAPAGDGTTGSDPTGGAGATTPSVEEQLEGNFATFSALVDDAERAFAAGRDTAAAVHAQMAASSAFFHHPGVWASPRLERLLTDIGRRSVRPRAANRRGPSDGPQRVLHVLTRVYAIGGHSRMVWRWMDLDDERSHSVVLTRQGALPIPEPLVEAAASRGGTVRVLNQSRGTALTWAQDLRDTAAEFDLVVMHLFAEDILPLIAFADRTGLPPILFIDQADHAFSLGAPTSDLYVDLRAAGGELAIGRRHVAPDRVGELPIVIAEIERSRRREEAKRELGIDPGDVLLLSVARAPKYRTYEGHHYTEPFREIIDRHPRVRLVVVGPEVDDEWRSIERATDGRITAYGERPGTAVYYEAADVYVDSYPAVSNTSLLEAGSYGLPLVSRCLHPGEHSVFCADSPGFAAQIARSADLGEFTAALERLIEDPDHRRRVGDATRASILSSHVGPSWIAALGRLYERAAATSPITGPPEGPDRLEIDHLDRLWSELHGSDVGLADLRSWFVKGLPLDLRARVWFEIAREQRRPRLELLLPEWATARARVAVERMRQRIGR